MWDKTVFFLLIPLGFCLRITEVYVPNLSDVRGQAELRCVFELGKSRLNSVKWYKDEMEFFRYFPQPPTVTTFSVTGVHVLEQQSNSSVVTMYPLEYSSTGSYLCEVSTEAPLFKVDRRSANMTVMGVPEHEPLIEGVELAYNIGEYLSANCTTAPSKPAPVVTWLINDLQAKEWLLEHYRIPPTKNKHQLESKSVGLRFQLAPQHFYRHQLNLTCVANVQGLIKQSSVIVIPAELKNQKYAQERSRNSAAELGMKMPMKNSLYLMYIALLILL